MFEGDQVKPASFVALINTGIDASTFIEKETTMADVQDMITDYKSTAIVNEVEKDFFVMSNSVYSDGSIQVAAPITDEMICSTRDAAEKNPAIAYVERVAAKLEAKASAELTVEGKEVNLDGNNITLIPTITGMKFVHTNPYSYLLKNINGISEDWSDAANFRSYWANSATTKTYGYCNYNAIRPVEGFAEYCQENTNGTTTKLLVSATIKKENLEAVGTFLKYKGLYYTAAGFLTKINSMLSEYKYTTTNGEGKTVESNDWSQYLEIVDVVDEQDAKPWEVRVALTKDAPKGTGAENVISKLDKAAQWTDGKAYFYVDIEHLEDVSAVVRNHYYQLVINKIVGLGTPVYNPEETIIPEKMKDENYYVAAQVQILKWKFISQSVELN